MNSEEQQIEELNKKIRLKRQNIINAMAAAGIDVSNQGLDQKSDIDNGVGKDHAIEGASDLNAFSLNVIDGSHNLQNIGYQNAMAMNLKQLEQKID